MSTVKTVVGSNIERVSRDRISQSPIVVCGTAIILYNISQAMDNSSTAHGKIPPEPPAVQRTTGDATPKYVIYGIMDYDIANDLSTLYDVQWYGYTPDDNT